MTGMTSGSLQPTYIGHVATARDALKLFEACLRGQMHHVPRRPHDRERSSLIKSGCIFIYEENASGIKRWTDGVPWSPSRILGNFLVYRELIKPFPPGEKKRAQKRPKNNRAARTSDPYPTQRRASEDTSFNSASRTDSTEGREGERALIGSLVDSYGFKEGGLVKKTMSVNVNGVHHHLVSYYSIEDVLSGKLTSPCKDKDLDDIEPRQDLVARQNFRAPIDDLDLSVSDPLGGLANAYGGYTYDPYRAPPPQMMGAPHHPPHNPHMTMGMYSTPSYTTAPPTATSYSSIPVSQSYYPTTTMSQTPYPQTYVQTTHAPLPMTEAHHTPQHTYSYHHRQSYPPPHMPSRVGSIESITPTSEGKGSDSDWHRHGQSGSYSSLASPISAQSAYGPATTQWAPPPPRDDAWSYAPRTGIPKTGMHMPPHSAADNQSWRQHIPCP